MSGWTKTLQPALHRAHIMLDTLPPGAVVLDRFGRAWQQGGPVDPYWYRAYGDSSEVSSFELAQYGPVKVLSAAANGHKEET